MITWLSALSILNKKKIVLSADFHSKTVLYQKILLDFDDLTFDETA